MEPLLFGIGKITVTRLIDNLMTKRSMSLLKAAVSEVLGVFRS